MPWGILKATECCYVRVSRSRDKADTMTKAPHPWDLNEAADLYLNKDWTLGDLAKRYGVHAATMWQRLDHHPVIKERRHEKRLRNLETNKNKRDFSPVASDEQITRWAQGEHLARIAESYDMSPSALRTRLMNHPQHAEFLELRKKNKHLGSLLVSKVPHEEAAQLYREGHTIYTIAKKYDVTHQRVQQILAKRYPEILQERKKARQASKTTRLRNIQEKKANRSSLGRQYDAAIELYREGFCVREIREHYPNLNYNTFILKLCDKRKSDPTFPGERGRNGADWNWLPRMQVAIESTNSYVEGAALLGMNYGTFINRVHKMKAKGLLPTKTG